MDYISLTVTAVDASGQEYKTTDQTKWYTTEALPAPVDMEDDLLAWHVADLLADIEEVELALTESGADTTNLNARLSELEAKLGVACDDPRADCPTEEVQSNGGDAAETGLNTNVILIVIGVLIVAALLGLMFMRGGGGSEAEEMKWNEASLPVHDAVANSMYGGAQDLFQQPVAPIAAVAPPPAPVAAPAVPPLPPGGLPAGWSMEQWVHYGQQYLDQTRQQ
jgi:hypothetical protein